MIINNVTIFLLFIFSSSSINEMMGISIQSTEISNIDQVRNEWVSLKNMETVDGFTKIGDRIYGGDFSCYATPMIDVDVESFKVLPGSKYAKDKKKVYYPLQINCVDYEDCGGCHYEDVVVEGAVASTFHYLGKDYASDGTHAYFRGNTIPNADGATFKVIEGPEYFFFATDKNNVYIHNTIFPEADPSSFYYDKSANVDPYSYIIGDKNHVWKYMPPKDIELIK